ncbi:cyclic pyranopterin monophosphate synthase MoaC [Bacillus lacus]|uniref:Cyclic pyranopterin monophosphate synthase n=1 Tax=Metabacillus lacus TaxID=1983721 RepID=A0A7X2IZZ6_9BACI|nr:cyclic pyranopterin monophosphate synthase MoaC [Metabacillus lacus]MRX72764.1 cyclic pyranopterin monophosphate synthase MoaC [Metabacillus lacus]
MAEFTHFNEQGRAKMVDVGDKQPTKRFAAAKSRVTMPEHVCSAIRDKKLAKGDVLAVAQVAGIMAAKNTSSIIPMCHPIPITGIDIQFEWNLEGAICHLDIAATVKTEGKTGVEMEALTSASACALTVYDMCKALDKGLVIGPTYLVEKTGGKNGEYKREEPVKE